MAHHVQRPKIKGPKIRKARCASFYLNNNGCHFSSYYTNFRLRVHIHEEPTQVVPDTPWVEDTRQRFETDDHNYVQSVNYRQAPFMLDIQEGEDMLYPDGELVEIGPHYFEEEI